MKVNVNNILSLWELLFMMIACSDENNSMEISNLPATPNIIIYFSDDMGWGDAGCYGKEKILTPNTDRMAETGLRFTNAFIPKEKNLLFDSAYSYDKYGKIRY
jgi:hypothetical protein